MTRDEWANLLQTFITVREAAEQTLIATTEHINMPCTHPPSFSGLLGNRFDLDSCDRGTKGCSLDHNDKEALVFAKLTLERILEIDHGDEPMPDIDPLITEI